MVKRLSGEGRFLSSSELQPAFLLTQGFDKENNPLFLPLAPALEVTSRHL